VDQDSRAYRDEYGLPTIEADGQRFKSDTFRNCMKQVMERRCANCGKRLHDGYEMFQQKLCEFCYYEATEEYNAWLYQQDLDYERRQRLVGEEV